MTKEIFTQNLYTKSLTNCLYLPASPVNIISVPALSEQLNDDKGTCIQSKRQYSIFTWDHGKYSKTIYHSSDNFPELLVNAGYKDFKYFCSLFTFNIFNSNDKSSKNKEVTQLQIVMELHQFPISFSKECQEMLGFRFNASMM